MGDPTAEADDLLAALGPWLTPHIRHGTAPTIPPAREQDHIERSADMPYAWSTDEVQQRVKDEVAAAVTAARLEVKTAVEEWFSNVSCDDLFACRGWTPHPRGGHERATTAPVLTCRIPYEEGVHIHADARCWATPAGQREDEGCPMWQESRGTVCRCVGYTTRTDYGTGVEHDVDRASCPVHSRFSDAELADVRTCCPWIADRIVALRQHIQGLRHWAVPAGYVGGPPGDTTAVAMVRLDELVSIPPVREGSDG